MHATNKAWKSLIDSSNDWDNFVWTAFEASTFDQQTLGEGQEQFNGNNSFKDEYYDCDESPRLTSKTQQRKVIKA